MTTELLKQIDDLVASKTFGLDALEGIKKVKDGLETSERERKALQEKHEQVRSALDKCYIENTQLKTTIDGLHKEVQAFKDREAKAREALWEKEVEKAKAEAYKDALYTVFKPSTMRETVFQSMPISQSSGGATYVSNYQQETRTTKEEL